MSTISIQAPLTVPVAAAAGRSVSTRLRLTARGRRLLAALAAAPVLGAIAFSLLAGGSAVASGESAEPVAFETVTVLPGDTLWSIAADAAPGVDPREVIDDIKSLNNLSSGMIQVGASIAIPTAYSE
ncbi:LysM peptidoglycan-binding domain-containing protein [Microbacterium esteraromaticum]|uniref:LysM peptidoglycan-binding domain-containing protein n=1 Tax=Microbacterium esteraromaticum TaxID=57043 RepID=UPI0019576313|nr:LysM peptidoglycan-binding domain-containing protein [Microbacterium esteraromaticum]MBM7464971.1 LysM repeat protein [Microbacterium esteraromaticum]